MSAGGRSVGIGVIGGRSFVARRAVLPAIDDGVGVHLAAVAARSGPVDDRWSDHGIADYDAVLAHPDVEAVYLPLPNGLHEEWTVKAAIAGKHVLCEKPLAPTATAAARMADACRAHGVILAEAWMTPFDLRWQRMLADARSGRIGEVERVDARFTFTIGSDAAANYRWRPEHGGGALLDVGIYTLGFAVELWGADAEHVSVRERVVTADGVDARTDAEVAWRDGRRARIVCSFVDEEVQSLSVVGSDGSITAVGDVFTGGPSATGHLVTTGMSQAVAGPAGDPYRAMVEAFGRAVRGDDVWPRPIDRTLDLMMLLDRIARQDVVP